MAKSWHFFTTQVSLRGGGNSFQMFSVSIRQWSASTVQLLHLHVALKPKCLVKDNDAWLCRGATACRSCKGHPTAKTQVEIHLLLGRQLFKKSSQNHLGPSESFAPASRIGSRSREGRGTAQAGGQRDLGVQHVPELTMLGADPTTGYKLNPAFTLIWCCSATRTCRLQSH